MSDGRDLWDLGIGDSETAAMIARAVAAYRDEVTAALLSDAVDASGAETTREVAT